MDPVDKIIFDKYCALPAGRDRLWSAIRVEHPEISRRRVATFLSNLESHQMHLQRKTFSSSTNIIISQSPLQRFQVDLVNVDKYSSYNDGVKYWLTVVDHFSKYIWIVLLKDATSGTVAKAFEPILDKYKPAMVQSDNGMENIGKEFETLLTSRNVKHLYSLPHSAWTQGLVEVSNKTIKNYVFRWMTLFKTNRYVDNIQTFVEQHNNSISSAHGYKPIDVINNKVPFDNVKRKMMERKEKKKISRNTIKPLNIGDSVRVSIEVLYLYLKNYHPVSEHRKKYMYNWSEEIFQISKIIKNEDFLNGYYLKYNNVEIDKLIRPHHVLKIDVNHLIKNPVVPSIPKPILTQMQERKLEPTRTELKNPPTLDSIFEDDDDQNDEFYF